MNSTPRLNRFLFVAFIFLSFCVGSAALFSPQVRSLSYAPLRDSLFPNFYLNPQAGKPVTLLVAVPSALENWVKDSTADFSSQNPLITVELTVVRGVDAGRRLNVMTGIPDVWIAESDWTRTAAGGIPFETEGWVVAQDSFVWTVWSGSRADALSQLDWGSISRLAASDPQFRLAVPPEGSVEGMGGCLSAAAEYFQQSVLTADQINDASFQRWKSELLESVPDLKRNPFDQLTSRPPQADAAFLPLSDGRRLDGSAFLLQAPQSAAVLNFTFYIRSSWLEIEDWEAELQRQAAEKFRAHLLSGGVQGGLAAHGLSGPGADFPNPVRPADEHAVYALQFCWSRQGGNA
ncbi:MAG: substrate-binding domain-containing protein [Anaerolineales bacterium]|nr:substrate-binding domain-containing protein [Anaerolineales bacterium]